MSDISIRKKEVQPTVAPLDFTVKNKKTANKTLEQDTLSKADSKKHTEDTNPLLLSLLAPSTSSADELRDAFEALDKEHMQQADDQVTNNQTFATLAEALKDKSLTAAKLLNALDSIASSETTLVETENLNINQQQQANQGLATSLSGSQAQLNLYNAAQSKYSADYEAYNNNPTQQNQDNLNASLTALQSAISTYNTYVNSTVVPAVNTYNTSVTTYLAAQAQTNTTIDQLNPSRVQFGVPALNRQTQTPNPATALSTITLGTGSPYPPPPPAAPQTTPYGSTYGVANTLSPVTDTTSADELYVNVYEPIVAILNAAGKQVQSAITVAENIDQTRKTNTSGVDPFGSNSFITRHHKISALSVAFAGGGEAFGQAIVKQGGGSSNLESTISNAASKALAITNVHTQFIAAVNARKVIGLPAIKSAQGQKALSVAFGITNGQAVQNLIQSNVVKDEVTRQINSAFRNQKVDDATRNDAINRATDQVNQNLILNAVAQQGFATNSPGLYGQFLANQAQLKDADLKQSNQRQLSLEEIVNDPQKQIFLKSTVANQLVAEDSRTSRVNAEKLVNDTFNSLIQQGSLNNKLSEDDVKNAILATFTQNGIEVRIADKLANKASDILKAERTSQDRLYAQSFDPIVLGNILQSQGVANANKVAEKALNATIENSFFVNNNQFQIALQDELVNQGLSTTLAATVAQQLNLTSANSASAGAVSPLASSTVSSVLSKDQLASNVHSSVVGAFGNGVGETQAQALADQAVAAFITGAKPSLFDLYQSTLNRQERAGVTTVQQLDNEQKRTELKLTFQDQMTLNQAFEPSKLFLTFGLSGYGAPQHKGDKKATDSPVGPA